MNLIIRTTPLSYLAEDFLLYSHSHSHSYSPLSIESESGSESKSTTDYQVHCPTHAKDRKESFTKQAAGFYLDAPVALECNPSMTPKVFNINRRRFIKTTAAITAATGVPGWFLEVEQAHAAQPKPLGPNDRPGIALVGCGGRR